MKTLTVRLPEALASQIDAESRARRISRSDVVRERLESAVPPDQRGASSFDSIADLVGALDGLPPDLSAQTKHHLKATGYGLTRDRRKNSAPKKRSR